MADKPDKTSAFTSLAALTLLTLLAAAGIAWLQQSDASGSDPARAALAALSQSIPLQASRVRDGNTEAFAALDANLARLTEARDAVAVLPGNRANWDALASHGASIAARRAAITAVVNAAGSLREATPALVDAAGNLLDQSGATAALQEFQQRAATLADRKSVV